MSGLKAYRFSAVEMNKMLWLKALFTENDFTVDRFPEVYYDTFKNACKEYPQLERHNEDGTPDYLGVYIFSSGDEPCLEKCSSTKEGVIILFSDRITDFSIDLSSKIAYPISEIENAIREVVLYHELGHWLSHWSICSGVNWKCGYSALDKITHEVFAQLTAYWVVDGQPLNSLILKKYLTPERHTSPYNKYLDLIGKSKVDILSKLHLLRKFWCDFRISDEMAFELLKMELIEKCVSYAFEKSVRNIKLEPQSLNNEIAFQILAMGWSLEGGELTCIEYDYALCKLVALNYLQDEDLKETLKFDKRYCSEDSQKGIRLIHKFGL